MAEARHIAAVDLGAASGRVVLGRLRADRVELEVVHRFENEPVWLPDGLHWNLPTLFEAILRGLAASAGVTHGRLDSVGVDSWGCDYGLLDSDGRLLGLPYHYRDARTSEELVARVLERVGRERLYHRTGIQTLPINTVFQLSAQIGSPALAGAERIALVPDLIGMWLTGNLANELTVASTTGLLDARTGAWAADLVDQLGLPPRPFDGELVSPGFPLGPVLSGHAAAGEAVGAPVHAVAGHDTASAFAAAPLDGRSAAILSSGTWSLLGVELQEPRLTPEAAEANLTNERGLAGTVRLLRNVMGLWLVQQCRSAWARSGEQVSFEELVALAARALPEVPLFDPDHRSLLAPGGDMPQRITALCTAAGQAAPRDRGEMVRSILLSLACKYRLVLERLEAVAGRQLEVIHVVGGGARDELLCQLTADVCEREVLAGPTEATALGNVLVQALALGDLGNLCQLREVSRRSVSPRRFEPCLPRSAAQALYERFLSLTGLRAREPAEVTA